MILLSIKFNQLRNLKESLFSLSPRFNIFYGRNGSGKTSILEGVHLLTTARSFRSRTAEEFITHGASSCVLSGHLKPGTPDEHLIRMGVMRDKTGGIAMRVNEKTCATRAELAQILPVQILNTESYQLLHLPPKARRDFLDWSVFHVEHSFHSVWLRYTRALKQRNAALKRVRVEGEGAVNAWESELVESGTEIAAQRRTVLDRFLPFFLDYVQEFLPSLLDPAALKIELKQGWPPDRTLKQALQQAKSRDIQLGYTSVGPHRADLNFYLEETAVQTRFSRGQLKLFVSALMLARSEWLLATKGRRSLFLLDDIHSELDAEASGRLMAGLKRLGGQVWITAIEPGLFEDCLQGEEEVKMFHVEHGVLRESVLERGVEG